MQSTNYVIRNMSRAELEMAVQWAAEEGWNPGLHDAECYYTADPKGFWVGMLDGEPIATISAMKYGQSFGFIGFYIVRPEYRGKGYGIQIWKAAMDSLAGRNIGLDGVIAQQENYKKSGFTLAYRNIRYEGTGGGETPNAGIVPLNELPFESVEAYDQPFFPEKRTDFLRSWIRQPGCHSLGVLRDGKLAGYGVIRSCLVGYKIGPLYANDPALAEQLFLALKSKASSAEKVFLDTPETNPTAVALAETYGMTVSFETARMYSQPAPPLPLARLFGVTSFEIG